MRLDHLLSKEHLPAKVGKGPALPGCGGGVLIGGDTGKSEFGNGSFVSTALVSVGEWKAGDAAGAGVKQTPCWVLKEQAPLFGLRVLDGRLHVGTKPFPFLWVRLCFGGVGGCLLRIVQWMRASLWSSC